MKKIRNRRIRQRRQTPFILGPIIIAVIAILLMQVLWIEKNRDKFLSNSVSRLLEKVFEKQKLTVGCPHCDGDGWVRDTNGNLIVCPICFGVGRHYLRITDDHDGICTECLGMGRIMRPDGTAAFCPRCGGRGIIRKVMPPDQDGNPVTILQIACDHCEERGFTRDPETRDIELCPVCFGLGYHWARKINDNESICAACGGMGRIYDPTTQTARVCKRCGGRGLITSKP